jgi:hypothetical protein
MWRTGKKNESREGRGARTDISTYFIIVEANSEGVRLQGLLSALTINVYL